ncbi:uncharacterized protein LOC127806746 [Diospyros lotus]|uniref:uncharacterized protein LOC127806746 n=1 Tax=Diospyros lotus TaxID=55363 RepID=UPI00225A59BF|nr:uncharacterized protein LOC127806746 [Diospyros lotus]
MSSLYLLFLLVVLSLCISRRLLPKLNLFAISMKWIWDFLFPNRRTTNTLLPENGGGEVSIKRYEAGEAAECPVCLCKIDAGEEIRELRCAHLFHRDCLDRWVGYKHRTCPLCRGCLAPGRRATELGEEVLSFKFCDFGSSSGRSSWWLR